jgi:beta-phosphoglucomutase
MHKPERDPYIAAVIFDLDGVITNTVYFHYLSWQRLADEERIPFDKATHDRHMLGLNREDALSYLLNSDPTRTDSPGERLRQRQISQTEQQQLLTRKNNYYLELIAELDATNLLPGIRNLLIELHTAGVKIALGSSSKNAEVVLNRLGIIQFFDFIADGHSVPNLKPAPDVFLYAAESINIAPHDCLVIEDAPAGVAAGLAAGMWVLGVGPFDRLKSAHLVLSTLGDTCWRDILSKLNYSEID